MQLPRDIFIVSSGEYQANILMIYSEIVEENKSSVTVASSRE